MRLRLAMMVAGALAMSVAWADDGVTMPAAGTPEASTQELSTRTTTTTTTIGPSGTVMVTETTQLSGPVALNLWPEPPAAIVTRTVLDDPVVLVLGSQEDYALRQLPEDRVSWWLAPNAYDSLFAQGNPLTYYRPNRHVTRHGNPYAPYFQVPVPELVAGTQESYILVPAPGRARTVMTTQGTVLGTTETFPATAPAPATPIPPDPVPGCPPIR